MKEACDVWHLRLAPSSADWMVTAALISLAGEGQHKDEPGQLAGCQPWGMCLRGGADDRQHIHPGESPRPKR